MALKGNWQFHGGEVCEWLLGWMEHPCPEAAYLRRLVSRKATTGEGLARMASQEHPVGHCVKQVARLDEPPSFCSFAVQRVISTLHSMLAEL